MQGFLFSPALSSEAIRKLLQVNAEFARLG